MSQELTGTGPGLTKAEEAFLTALAGQNPSALVTFVNNLFSPGSELSIGTSIPPMTTTVPDTAVVIPASYTVGEKYDLGLYLGRFDLGEGVGKKPVFVVELTEPMVFHDAVRVTGAFEDGYEADAKTYDANAGLREGKKVIAPYNIVNAAYEARNEGAFKELFKGVDSFISTSSSHGMNNSAIMLHCFKDCKRDKWDWKCSEYRRPNLLVRAGELTTLTR